VLPSLTVIFFILSCVRVCLRCVGLFHLRLTSQPPGETCCAPAFCCEQGVKLSFFYSHVKEVAEGIVVDYPGLGGTRTKGHFAGDGIKSGAEHDDPSSAAFMSRACFKYLIETEDTAPNKPKEKGSVQIDIMETRELYDEYVMAMQYCLGPGESVLSYDQWIDI